MAIAVRSCGLSVFRPSACSVQLSGTACCAAAAARFPVFLFLEHSLSLPSTASSILLSLSLERADNSRERDHRPHGPHGGSKRFRELCELCTVLLVLVVNENEQ